MPAVVALLIVAAAWLPSVRRYVPTSDDFPLADYMNGGVAHYLSSYTPTEGVWRIFQQPMVAGLTRPGGALFPAVAFALNLIAAAFFYGCCRRLARSPAVAAMATVLTFAFPWGFQAVVWASAFGNVVTTTLLLGTLYALLTARRRRRAALAVALVGVTLVANLTQENLVFSYAAVGLLAVVPRRRMPLRRAVATAARRLRTRYDAWTPAVTAVLFIVVFVTTRTPDSQKKGSVHLLSALSVFGRQYANVWVFGVWRSRACVAEAWRATGPLWYAGGAVFAIAVALLILRAWSPRRVGPPNAGRVVATVVLFAGAAGIFALSGGWSNETRKKYDVVPLLVLAAATGLAQPLSAWRSREVVVALGLLAVPTTWVATGTYAAESARAKLLYDALAADAPSGPVTVRWVPDAYAEWSQLYSLLGIRFDLKWTVREAMDSRGRPPVDIVTPGDPVPPTATVYTVTADVVERTPARRKVDGSLLRLPAAPRLCFPHSIYDLEESFDIEKVFARIVSSDGATVAKTLAASPELISATDERGNSLLDYAIGQDRLDIATTLVASHADLSATNIGGDTPLHIAAADRKAAIIRMLFEIHADANAKDHVGRTPLHLTVLSGLPNSAPTDVLRALLVGGAVVDSRDFQGVTPLQDAVLLDQKDAAEFLLRNKADINAKDDNGLTVLHDAALCGIIDMVELGLARGSAIDAEDKMGRTPLDLAADPDAGSFQFDAETTLKRRKLVELLLSRKAKYNAFDAAATGDLNGVKAFVKADPSIVRSRGWHGRTLLHYAAMLESKEMVELLLAFKADVNAADDWGNTPLHRAAGAGRVEVVRYLLSSGANANAKSKGGTTPLHLASAIGHDHADVAELLLQSGADVDAKTDSGNTPLVEAARTGDVADLLKRHGGRL